MHWCRSYKGLKWGVRTAPPSKHLARCYLSTPFNSDKHSHLMAKEKWNDVKDYEVSVLNTVKNLSSA